MNRRRRLRGPLPLLAALLVAAPTVPPAGAGPARPAAAAAPAVVTVMAAGDIAPEPSSPKADDVATSQLVLDAGPTAVLALGDNQYDRGTLAEYQSPTGYEGSWGRFKASTRPTLGNHEYLDPAGGAAGYFGYFGPVAGNPAEGWYSFDLGAWHVVSLNSACGGLGSPSCARGSPQVRWLQADLSRNPRACTLAFWHHPRFSNAGGHGDDPRTAYLWNALYAAKADLILNGHTHNYQRFTAMHPRGRVAERGAGIRQIVVGTGGKSLYRFASKVPRPGTRHRDDRHYGVVRLTLGPDAWSSEFHRTDGEVADRVTAGCWR
jgi:acid phosphatase type 7